MVTSQTRSLKALQTAIQMEKDGKKFYLKMSQTSQNDLGTKLFQELAAEEDIHLKKFEQIFSVVNANIGWPTIEFAAKDDLKFRTLFATAADSARVSSVELGDILTAMDMENKSRDFYLERSKKATSDIEKIYYKTLAGEEAVHHALLLDYHEYLKDPAHFFTMKERHSLDGG